MIWPNIIDVELFDSRGKFVSCVFDIAQPRHSSGISFMYPRTKPRLFAVDIIRIVSANIVVVFPNSRGKNCLRHRLSILFFVDGRSTYSIAINVEIHLICDIHAKWRTKCFIRCTTCCSTSCLDALACLCDTGRIYGKIIGHNEWWRCCFVCIANVLYGMKSIWHIRLQGLLALMFHQHSKQSHFESSIVKRSHLLNLFALSLCVCRFVARFWMRIAHCMNE